MLLACRSGGLASVSCWSLTDRFVGSSVWPTLPSKRTTWMLLPWHFTSIFWEFVYVLCTRTTFISSLFLYPGVDAANDKSDYSPTNCIHSVQSDKLIPNICLIFSFSGKISVRATDISNFLTRLVMARIPPASSSVNFFDLVFST